MKEFTETEMKLINQINKTDFLTLINSKHVKILKNLIHLTDNADVVYIIKSHISYIDTITTKFESINDSKI